MNEAAITNYIATTFTGVDIVRPEERGGPEIAWGDTFFIYDPQRDLAPNLQLPFATIVTKDYDDFDRASNLNRPAIFRLNIGLSRNTYSSLFGSQPSAPDMGEVVATGHDFTALDQLLPHPVYAHQSWVCVLNPGPDTFQTLHPLLAEAYDRAVKRYDKARLANTP